MTSRIARVGIVAKQGLAASEHLTRLTDWLCARRIAPVFETARMYRGSVPALPLNRIFGVTTFELG